MNVRDSEALLGLFVDKGYLISESAEDADVILVNTCSVREHAEDRAVSFLGFLKKIAYGGERIANREETFKKLSAKSYKPSAKPVIGLIGCMAVNRGEEIFKKMQHIDLICGPASFARIPAYVEKILDKGTVPERGQSPVRRIIDIEDKPRDESFYQAIFRKNSLQAQVVISTGCSNFCSYCVVPYVRGLLRPRAPEDIINEVKSNIAVGRRKITLLGQNVNDYSCEGFDRRPGKGVVSFVDLLRMVAGVPGLADLDFITAQPKNTSFDLLYFMAESDRVKKHLHLPFQSGSNRILELMSRGYSREDYLTLVQNYKKIVKGTLSTDVIVGFPSESEEDFKQTKDMLEKVKFSHAFIFKYSPRKPAKSFELADDVPKDVKIKRHKILLDLQKKISLGVC